MSDQIILHTLSAFLSTTGWLHRRTFAAVSDRSEDSSSGTHRLWGGGGLVAFKNTRQHSSCDNLVDSVVVPSYLVLPLSNRTVNWRIHLQQTLAYSPWTTVLIIHTSSTHARTNLLLLSTWDADQSSFCWLKPITVPYIASNLKSCAWEECSIRKNQAIAGSSVNQININRSVRCSCSLAREANRQSVTRDGNTFDSNSLAAILIEIYGCFNVTRHNIFGSRFVSTKIYYCLISPCTVRQSKPFLNMPQVVVHVQLVGLSTDWFHSCPNLQKASLKVWC